ncbi:C-factor [Grifola frondosa]|uniref:C-factor n=1 Tax=Grifola frondosa TaxID=5627 RepID=A0A1C7M9Z4_GRIFR|nr:C-factor [Grifola frondosa]
MNQPPDEIRQHILASLQDVDPNRLKLLRLELSSEESVALAAEALAEELPRDAHSYIDTAFFAGGVLHPERRPADLRADDVLESFKINVIAHLFLIKHFSRFLPPRRRKAQTPLWVHVSARVGSISDNRLGGWYSYRASKAALNQVIRTFDRHLVASKIPAMCVGVHPGTVMTDLSRPFWGSVHESALFKPEYAAERLAAVVKNLEVEQRGRVWDWAGKEVPP